MHATPFDFYYIPISLFLRICILLPPLLWDPPLGTPRLGGGAFTPICRRLSPFVPADKQMLAVGRFPFGRGHTQDQLLSSPRASFFFLSPSSLGVFASKRGCARA